MHADKYYHNPRKESNITHGTYDEQPGYSTDDYIRDPDYPAEAYF